MTIGCFNGKLSPFQASALGSVVIREALNRASVRPEEVSEVIMGQVIELAFFSRDSCLLTN